MSSAFLEDRLSPLVWPDFEAVEVAVPPERDVIGPTSALQATIATASLAIAVMNLFRRLPPERASVIAASLERFIFERIREDREYYAVGSILRLDSDRASWNRAMLDTGVDVMAKLDTIILAVHGDRLAKYQQECQKGTFELVAFGSRPWSYGPLGFLAKRWLSEVTGQAITRDDDLGEEGFEGLGSPAFYFSTVCIAMVEQIET